MSSTDRLVTGLVEDLEPVRPVPRLRSAFAIILACWAALLGVVLFTQESEIGARSLMADRIYLASFVGLLIAALGGTVSALASGVPGREQLEIGGTFVAVVGLAAAAIACLIGVNELGHAHPPTPEGADAMCFQRGAFLSLLPGGVILSFLVRGWALRPVRAALVALLGAGALGAVVVHLSCDFLGPRHLLMSHLAVPLALALLGLYPLAVLIRRLRG